MDTITITVAENDPDVIVSATLNEDAVTITLDEAAVGATGAGVPTGGFANDILKKTSSTNYATGWETPVSTATASTIVRRDASGGAAFDDLTAVTVATTGAISTSGANASIYTTGSTGTIHTSGATADIYTFHASASVTSYNFKALDATAGAALRNSAGTAVLTWGVSGQNLTVTAGTGVTLDATSYTFGTGAAAAMKTALAIASSDITDATSSATANMIVRRDASGGAAFVALTGTGNWSTTGHFFSNPSTAEAGHFITKNGTTPTLAAGRSAWFSSTAGAPQFKNGTSNAVTLVYNSGALGTPSSGTLTNCTGLPIATGLSDIDPIVLPFLQQGNAPNLLDAVGNESTGTGYVVFQDDPALTNPALNGVVAFNSTDYIYGPGAGPAHRTALELTGLATTTPGTGVATALGVNVGTAGSFVVNGGALGTPSSGTVTNLTGTASININGTVGATTRNTGAFTTLAANGATTLTANTASTSSTTGTLVVTGGVGASGAIYTNNRIWTNSGGAPVVLGGLAVGDSVYGGLWINQASPSSSNYSFLGQAGQSLFNATSSGTVEFRASNISIINVGPNGVGIGIGNNTAPTLSFEVKATTTRFSVSNSGSISFEKTITAGGTTGAQTINKASGSVNFAAAATSLVVTNSLCTTSSVINATMATNDATASGLRVVAGTGSFTIYMLVAPTAETRVNFFLTN